MLIETKMMGKAEVSEEHIITIPSGLFGFEEYTDFALLESEYKPFVWLQSLQEKNLAFLLIDPFLICSDYEADIDDKEMLKIGIKDPSDVEVMAIVTIPSDGKEITANLQGPLVINRKNNQCMQAILDGSKWTTKHNILATLQSKEDN
ncbi:MAG: flagellar assembly protein FliW [Spirochaetia bacterium]|nr:flagellar assembly protein FliW [Spirochaetia bacterium]